MVKSFLIAGFPQAKHTCLLASQRQKQHYHIVQKMSGLFLVSSNLIGKYLDFLLKAVDWLKQIYIINCKQKAESTEHLHCKLNSYQLMLHLDFSLVFKFLNEYIPIVLPKTVIINLI